MGPPRSSTRSALKGTRVSVCRQGHEGRVTAAAQRLGAADPGMLHSAVTALVPSAVGRGTMKLWRMTPRKDMEMHNDVRHGRKATGASVWVTPSRSTHVCDAMERSKCSSISRCERKLASADGTCRTGRGGRRGANRDRGTRPGTHFSTRRAGRAQWPRGCGRGHLRRRASEAHLRAGERETLEPGQGRQGCHGGGAIGVKWGDVRGP